MTKLEEFLLSRMTVRRWLLALLATLLIGASAGWYFGHEFTHISSSAAPANRATQQPKNTEKAATIAARQLKNSENAPSIEAFRAFLEEFVPQMKVQIEATGNAGTDWIRKINCTLYSADLKKTDSVINPIVGLALVNVMDSMDSRTTQVMNTTFYLYTITFAADEHGKWRVIGAVQKIREVIAFPEHARLKADVGQEREIALDWIEAAAANAQK